MTLEGARWSLSCAFAALRHRPGRTLVMVGTMAAAVCSVTITRTLTERPLRRGAALVQAFEDQYLIAYRGYTTWFDVREVVPGDAIVRSYPFLLLPYVDEDEVLPLSLCGLPNPAPPELDRVVQLASGAWPDPSAPGLLVESEVAARLGVALGGTLALFGEEIPVVGLHVRDPSVIAADVYAPIALLQRLAALPERASFVLLRASPGHAPLDALAGVQAALPELRVIGVGAVRGNMRQVGEPLRRIGGALTMTAGLFAAVVVLLGWLGSVDERRTEFAVLRTMGARTVDLAGRVLLEASLVAALALALGSAAAGVIAVALLPRVHPAMGGGVDAIDLAVAIVGVGAAGLGGAVLPALRAARADPWVLIS